MNFSINRKLSKVLSLILGFTLLASLFAGCKKDDQAGDTTPDDNININLEDDTTPGDTASEPVETEPTVINENMATVMSQLNVRSSPSTEATIVGTLYAGDKVEVLQRHTVAGIPWGYIAEPSGWVVMEFVQMDHEPEDTTGGEETPDETQPQETTGNGGTGGTTVNIKGVVTTGLNIRSEASTEGKIVGNYKKGDVVTILETKNGWGRTNKGWIKMQYVQTEGNNTTGNDTNKPGNSDVTGNGSTTVQFKGIVIASELNIRATPSTDGERVGGLKYGDRVEILEKSGNWGRTSKGWISLDYVYQDGTTGKKTASGIVTGNQVNLRSGPGTGYGSVGTLNAGDRVNILEQFTYNGTTWGCTKNGWVCLSYVYIDGTGTGNDKTGIVTGDQLNIRSGPGTGYDSVGSLNAGDTVVILYQVTVDGTTWGNIKNGWISMKYVQLQ